MLRQGRVAVGAACVVAGLGGVASAQRETMTIDVIPMTLVDASGTTRQVDLGQVSVTLSNRGGAGMSAVFRVDDEFKPSGPGGAIWEHVEIHWVNVITADDCPATVRGVPAGRSALPFPVVDMPRNGWDYVYKSRRGSRRGGPEREEHNADGLEMQDDARDIWPWYHTPEEEAMEDGSGNEGGGFGQFREGVVYGIRDLPSLCGGGGVTAFTTLLVAVAPAGGAGEGGAHLQYGQLLVLAGFDWDWTTDGLRLAETSFGIDDLNVALANSNFPEWEGVEGEWVYVGDSLGERHDTGVEEPVDSPGGRPSGGKPPK